MEISGVIFQTLSNLFLFLFLLEWINTLLLINYNSCKTFCMGPSLFFPVSHCNCLLPDCIFMDRIALQSRRCTFIWFSPAPSHPSQVLFSAGYSPSPHKYKLLSFQKYNLAFSDIKIHVHCSPYCQVIQIIL